MRISFISVLLCVYISNLRKISLERCGKPSIPPVYSTLVCRTMFPTTHGQNRTAVGPSSPLGSIWSRKGDVKNPWIVCSGKYYCHRKRTVVSFVKIRNVKFGPHYSHKCSAVSHFFGFQKILQNNYLYKYLIYQSTDSAVNLVCGFTDQVHSGIGRGSTPCARFSKRRYLYIHQAEPYTPGTTDLIFIGRLNPNEKSIEWYCTCGSPRSSTLPLIFQWFLEWNSSSNYSRIWYWISTSFFS